MGTVLPQNVAPLIRFAQEESILWVAPCRISAYLLTLSALLCVLLKKLCAQEKWIWSLASKCLVTTVSQQRLEIAQPFAQLNAPLGTNVPRRYGCHGFPHARHLLPRQR